jgi:hypothetical protein
MIEVLKMLEEDGRAVGNLKVLEGQSIPDLKY